MSSLMSDWLGIMIWPNIKLNEKARITRVLIMEIQSYRLYNQYKIQFSGYFVNIMLETDSSRHFIPNWYTYYLILALIYPPNFFFIFLRCSVLAVTSNINLNSGWSHQCWGAGTFIDIGIYQLVGGRSNISRCWPSISLFISMIRWATSWLIFCMRLLDIFITIIDIFFFIFITSFS